MKKTVIAVLMLIILSPAFSQVTYTIDTFEGDYTEKLHLNKFYFVRYIYFDFLMPFKLHNGLDIKSKNEIYNNIYKGIQNNYQKQFSITSITPVNLIIRLKLFKTGNDMSLIVYTNYDVEKKSLVSIDAEPDKFYAKQYFLIKDKLVPGKYFYERDKDKQKIKEFIAEKQFNKAADFILFDSDLGNDKEALSYIKKGLKQDISLKDKMILKLTLMEYFLIHENYSDFSKTFKEIEGDRNKLDNEKDKKYIQKALFIMKDIMTIMKNI